MSTAYAQAQPTRGKLVFISYARADQEAADRIRQAVVAMHHAAWIDSNLEGGHEWWDEILAQLQHCDALIVVVSPELLDSEAATAERVYAQALGKPLIPIKVAEVRDDLLPPDITDRQYIDFTRPTPLTGIQLANVLYELPAAGEPPATLPAAPPIPRSYLSGISEMLHRPSLSDDEQRAIAGKLSDALHRPRERDAATELLDVLENRRDLYASTQREITRIRREMMPQSRSEQSPPAKTPVENAAQSRPPDPGRQLYQDSPQRAPVQPQWQAPPNPNPSPGPWASPARPGYQPSFRAAGQPGYQPAASPGVQPPPQHWGLSITGLVLSVLAVIPLGLVAVIMSSQVTARWNRGDHAGAFKASRLAVAWGWVGIGWGALALLSYLYLAQQSTYYYY